MRLPVLAKCTILGQINLPPLLGFPYQDSLSHPSTAFLTLWVKLAATLDMEEVLRRGGSPPLIIRIAC
jgi:hypothetical protein